MRVRFHGAAGEVTGSMHEVEFGTRRVLLDCGMIQGSESSAARNADAFPFDPEAIDAVVLSHAHIDHCGRLPRLVAQGFRGPIWTQVATAELTRIMLLDSASLAEADAERARRHLAPGDPVPQPLYSRDDVERTMRQMRTLDYDEQQEILPGVRLRLRDAGHILGSAAIELREGEGVDARTLVFSGDIGPRGTPILRDPVAIEAADLVLMESTYGDRLHRDRLETVRELGAIFARAREERGNVLIPAFAVGRSQELLYWFAKHWDEWELSRWTIFLDSPMAARVVEVYARHADLFDAEAQQVWRGKPNPFKLPNLHPTVDAAASRGINAHRGGAIIIAGSGMCEGGRIRHHLRHNLGRGNAHLVFVGYQAQGTLGRRLVDGAPRVRLFGDEIEVRAQRHTIGGLSAHADQRGLAEWYAGIAGHPPVYLVHGEDRAREALARLLHERHGAQVQLARPGMERVVD
jgi:metallo-beta-lactamase family protein